MNYLGFLQKHGFLLALVILLAGLLAATNSEMLSRFESFKFGPVEAKLRALSLKGRNAREVDAKEAGRQTFQRDTFGLWTTTRVGDQTFEASGLIERGRVISRQRRDEREPMLDAFDAFRREVVTPFADLDAALSRRDIDLFDQPFAPSQTLKDAVVAIDRSRPDDERASALCRATAGLLRMVEGLPEWISDRPTSSGESRCPSTSGIDGLVCEASASISGWIEGCSVKPQERFLRVTKSPYAIALVDTLIRRAMPNIEATESYALVHYINLLGYNKEIYPAIENAMEDFDLLGKILVTSLVHRATDGKIPPEQTSAMLLSHYAEIDSFVVSNFDAPNDRLSRYEPCESKKIDGASQQIPFITAKNVCERLEYVTLPGVLNNLLFSIAEAWIQGRPVERVEMNLSEDLLPRAEARLDILRTTQTDAVSGDETRAIYFGLLDTITLTKLMLAVEFDELPSKAKCRTILAGFDDVIRYLSRWESPGASGTNGTFTAQDSGVWQTLDSVRRRQQIAESYCGKT